MPNITAQACLTTCTQSAACKGVSFEGSTPEPPGLVKRCYLKSAVHFIPYEASDSKCTGETMPSDCPYNFFRVSGDINAKFQSMLDNLGATVPFLGNDSLSRPGAWGYPDMLEVGKLKSPQEDRSHFGAWSIVSSPLVLGFDMSDATIMDKVWPVITNKEVIAVNQAWAGSAGQLAAMLSAVLICLM